MFPNIDLTDESLLFDVAVREFYHYCLNCDLMVPVQVSKIRYNLLPYPVNNFCTVIIVETVIKFIGCNSFKIESIALYLFGVFRPIQIEIIEKVRPELTLWKCRRCFSSPQ